jgi:hypothetical protein
LQWTDLEVKSLRFSILKNQKEIQMKRLSLLVLVLFSTFLVCSTMAYAELTPPVNDQGSDAVVGAATDDTSGGDTSTVDLSDKNTDQPVQSPSSENTTPAGMAPGGPIEN